MPDNHRLPRCWRVLGCPDTGVCTGREHTCPSNPDSRKEPEPGLTKMGRQSSVRMDSFAELTVLGPDTLPEAGSRRGSTVSLFEVQSGRSGFPARERKAQDACRAAPTATYSRGAVSFRICRVGLLRIRLDGPGAAQGASYAAQRVTGRPASPRRWGLTHGCLDHSPVQRQGAPDLRRQEDATSPYPNQPHRPGVTVLARPLCLCVTRGTTCGHARRPFRTGANMDFVVP